MSYREIMLHLALTAALIPTGIAVYQWQTGAAAVPALIRALERDNFNQRRAALARLRELGPDARAAAPAILALAEDLESRDAPAAVTALARIDLSAARAAMNRAREGLRHPDVNTRRRAVERLGDLGPLARPAAPELIRATRDDDALVRDRALQALVRIGLPAAGMLPVLTAALDDPRDHVRHSAVVALDALPPEVATSALTALRRAERDPSNLIRQRVAHLLARIERDRGAASELSVSRLMLAHNRESILYTLHKLTLLGGDAAPLVPELAGLLKNREDSVRHAAAETLAAIGPAARAALPELRARLQDREPVIRESARRAIALIEGGPKP
jgi:HEAT repeat protein